MDDARFNKLPVWVKDRIRELEGKNERLESSLNEYKALQEKIIPESNVRLIDLLTSEKINISQDSIVEFILGSGSSVEVSIRGGELYVCATFGTLSVAPHASNVVLVNVQPFGRRPK